MSEGDKDENEEFPEFLDGGLAKFCDFRTGFVKLFRTRNTATGIASDNIVTAESCAISELDRLRAGAYILTEGQSLCVPHGFLPVTISLQSKDNVDKGTLLEKVQHSDANRHMLDVVGNQDSDGGVALQVEETGYRLKVIERERRSVAWIRLFSHCSVFNAMTYNTKLMGSTVFASLANAVHFADGRCTLRSTRLH